MKIKINYICTKMVIMTIFLFSHLSFAQSANPNLRIECIMIGQTDIYDIGRASEISLNRCEQWIGEVEKATGIPARVHRIDGQDYNRAFIAQFLENLQLDDPQNTILIFYGTGHGFNYAENILKYPVFGVHPSRKDFSENEFEKFGLSLQKDVHETLLLKGARFLITLGELCNELVDIPVPAIYRPMAPCSASYLELFSETRGDIIAASSKRDQLSFTSGLKGGVFFGEFLRSFYLAVDDCSKSPDWGTILDRSQKLTKDVMDQDPIYDVGYIDSPVTLLTKDVPILDKNQTTKRNNFSFPKKEKFRGRAIIEPKVIYITN